MVDIMTNDNNFQLFKSLIKSILFNQQPLKEKNKKEIKMASLMICMAILFNRLSLKIFSNKLFIN